MSKVKVAVTLLNGEFFSTSVFTNDVDDSVIKEVINKECKDYMDHLKECPMAQIEFMSKFGHTLDNSSTGHPLADILMKKKGGMLVEADFQTLISIQEPIQSLIHAIQIEAEEKLEYEKRMGDKMGDLGKLLNELFNFGRPTKQQSN